MMRPRVALRQATGGFQTKARAVVPRVRGLLIRAIIAPGLVGLK